MSGDTKALARSQDGSVHTWNLADGKMGSLITLSNMSDWLYSIRNSSVPSLRDFAWGGGFHATWEFIFLHNTVSANVRESELPKLNRTDFALRAEDFFPPPRWLRSDHIVGREPFLRLRGPREV